MEDIESWFLFGYSFRNSIFEETDFPVWENTIHLECLIYHFSHCKILSLYISSPIDSTKLEVTLKINRTDLSAVIQTFERFNYNLKASFHESIQSNDLDERYDGLMNFLDL